MPVGGRRLCLGGMRVFMGFRCRENICWLLYGNFILRIFIHSFFGQPRARSFHWWRFFRVPLIVLCVFFTCANSNSSDSHKHSSIIVDSGYHNLLFAYFCLLNLESIDQLSIPLGTVVSHRSIFTLSPPLAIPISINSADDRRFHSSTSLLYLHIIALGLSFSPKAVIAHSQSIITSNALSLT